MKETIPVRELIDKYLEKKKKIEETEGALRELRGSTWHIGLEKDERYPVKLLYSTLVKHRDEMVTLLAINITLHAPIPEA